MGIDRNLNERTLVTFASHRSVYAEILASASVSVE